MTNSKHGYDVFLNDKFIGFMAGPNQKNRRALVQDLIKSSHMGQWCLTKTGIEYCTTIGVHVRFEACKRLAEVLPNYRIDVDKYAK